MSIASQRGSVPKIFPTSRRFSRGDLIGGKYRLVDPVGAGAMGMVWVAKNELLDVDVAVKLLRVLDTQRADPNKLYQRLLQEARAAARLGHPGIVRIFDFGQEDDNTPFIVMELLEGESLAVLMNRERRLPVEQAIQMLLPIADALATAHGRGIVHRDVKPENIFLARDEYGRVQPKIVDFGVARFAEGRCVTRSGALMGTPDYMAPEQARGEEDIDHRVDLWALGVVLYELMVGRRPFASDGSHYLAVLRSIVHEPVRPILDYGIGDPALWLILERALRKRRNERWDTVRVFGEALALWLYERGVKEDLLGANLKTTWLQSGFDGIKIETSSMVPPRPDSDEVEGLLSSIDVEIGSVRDMLGTADFESGPRALPDDAPTDRKYEPTNLDTTLPPLARRKSPPAPMSSRARPPARKRRVLSLAGLFLVAFTMTSILLLTLGGPGRAIGLPGVLPPSVALFPVLRDDGAPRMPMKQTPLLNADLLEFSPSRWPVPEAAEPPRSPPRPPTAAAPVVPVAVETPPREARVDEPTARATAIRPPVRTRRPKRRASGSRPKRSGAGVPAASSYDFGF